MEVERGGGRRTAKFRRLCPAGRAKEVVSKTGGNMPGSKKKGRGLVGMTGKRGLARIVTNPLGVLGGWRTLQQRHVEQTRGYEKKRTLLGGD